MKKENHMLTPAITKSEIAAMLDQLDEFQVKRDALALAKRDALKAIIPQEIQQHIDDVDAEFALKAQAAGNNIATLTASIKGHVSDIQETVKGHYLQAVWSKGRESWDGELLSGFAIAHPEILTARKEGAPSVSLRAVK